MASDAFAGVGTVFKRGAVAIAEITSISGPNLTRGTIDVTNLDSTNGYREFIAGFRDGGEVTLSMMLLHIVLFLEIPRRILLSLMLLLLH
jgi:hypothetical protein